MNLKSLLSHVDFNLIQGSINTEVSTVENDSRKVTEGSLFFCISGSVSNGHSYIKEVVEKKVAAIVIEKDVDLFECKDITVIKVENTRYAMGIISAEFYGNPSKKLTVIGITGTKGKTTTTYMIKSMLEAAGYKTGLIGTIETIIGNKIIASKNTTSESIVIQHTLKEMVDARLDCVVMEVSSQGIMMNRIAGISFDYGIFTNLSEDHIGPEEHNSFDEYLSYKAKLFTLCKVGIFNIDDQYYKKILRGHTCRVLTYGMADTADYKAENLRNSNKDGILGICYKLAGKYQAEVKVGLPGEFSVYNSLAAIAIAGELGISVKSVLNILSDIYVKGRIERVTISDEFILIIDYAHNAISLESILKTLRKYNPSRLISLFGCGGNRSKVRRYEMGEVSGNLADFTIITSDNPRNEEPQTIINDIKKGIAKTNGKFIEIIDRKEAIRYALLNAQKGDMIVLAGKGHENHQEINGKKYYMDERELIKDILEEEDVSKICGYNNRYFT